VKWRWTFLQGSDGCFVAAFSVRGRAGRTSRRWPGKTVGKLASEFVGTSDYSVAILLTYGTARLLLADDGEAKEEDSYSPKCVVEDFSCVRLQTSS
jgi:hypothetical protein